MNFAKGRISVNWDVSEYLNLNYKQDTVATEYLNKFIDAGHSINQMMIYNCFESSPLPNSVNYIKSKFAFLNNTNAAVNLIRSGQYLPLHRDLYIKWKTLHNIKDINQIFRAIVMLENNRTGQILQIDADTVDEWQAGDWFGWVGSTEHAVYNFSLYDRYAIQITGLLK